MIWCLHGAVGMAEDWKDAAAEWSRNGEVVRRVDLWRFLDCEPMELAEFGKAFCEEVRAGGEPGNNILVGYSMGGRLALHALLEAAKENLFAGAVIVSAHPGLTDERERILRMAADAEWAGQALVGDWKEFLAKWDGQVVLNSEGAIAWGDRRKLEVRRQAVARSFMDWSLGKQEDLRPRLPALELPVRWVTGEQDQKFTALAGDTVPAMRQGHHVIVKEAGHRLPWEQPDSFVTLVSESVAVFSPPKS